MEEAGDSGAGPRMAPAHLRWDTAELESHRCTLATASGAPTEIILNFGAKLGSGDPAAAVRAELVRRIALNPLTAQNLAATLRRLIEEHDSRARPSK